jgi:hypothetical protein
MGRLTDAILQPGTGHSAGKNAPMVDLQYGGQMGYAPDLTEWVSNQAYVKRNVICLLVEAPKGFSMLPNPEKHIATLRALVELHAMSIEGLNQTLEVETTENPVGGGGEMQEDFTDVKRTRTQPVFRWNEKYGMPIATFFSSWIRNLIMDPDTKYPAITTLANVPADMLADMYSATMLFIEPDATHSKVVKSWLVTNMFPKSSGEITGRRDLTQANEPQSYDINFTGISQSGIGVDAFAQKLLDGIAKTGANPYLRPAFVQEIQADILATKKGYSNDVAALGSQAIKL